MAHRTEYWITNGTSHPPGPEHYAGTPHMWGISRYGTDTGKPYYTIDAARTRARRMNYSAAKKGLPVFERPTEIPEIYYAATFKEGYLVKV